MEEPTMTEKTIARVQFGRNLDPNKTSLQTESDRERNRKRQSQNEKEREKENTIERERESNRGALSHLVARAGSTTFE